MAETKRAKPKGSKAKAKPKKPAASAAQNGGGDSLADSVKNGAQSAVSGVAPVARKAALPLLAGGAAVAGVAGVIIANRANGRKKVLGVSLPKKSKLSLPKGSDLKSDAKKVTAAVTEAARQADEFGKGVSRIASSVQKAGETANDAAKKA